MKYSMLFIMLLLIATTGCTMRPVKLEGHHIPAPPTPISSVELPSQDINIGGAIKEKIRKETLPSGEENIEIVTFKAWYKYWPDFPLVTITPEVISSIIPYNYAYKTWNLKARWRWRGFHSGIETWWEQNKDESGKIPIGVDTTLKWTPDWKVVFNSTPKYPSGELAKRLTANKLDEIARNADQELNKKGDMSATVSDIWKTVQQPIDIGDGTSFSINPETAWVTPLRVKGDAADFSIGITARPAVNTEKVAKGEAKPLPALTQKPIQDDQFSISLAGSIKYKDAAEVLLQRLKDKSIETKMGDATIKDVTVSALNKSIVVGIKVDSLFYSDWVFLVGDLEYRSINYTFIVRDLHVELQTWNPFAKAAAWIFRGIFEKELQKYTYWKTRTANQETKALLEEKFNSQMKDDLRIRIVSLKPLVSQYRQVLFTTAEDMNVAMLAKGKLYRKH